MHRGYTKRWRKRWDKGYHYDPDLWLLMSYFIDHANYRDKEVYFPNVGLIPLKRGQHIFGTPQLSAFMRWDRSRTRRKLKILKSIDFLTIKSTNRYSIATVINYNTYQPTENENNHQNDQQTTSRRPADDQQTTTPNKDKKVKNKEARPEGFALPNSEILKEGAEPKILADLNMVCEKLSEDKIFPKADVFKNAMLKNQKNPRAILHALSRCYLKKEFKAGAWAYCEKIIQVENGNYNESDHQKTTA